MGKRRIRSEKLIRLLAVYTHLGRKINTKIYEKLIISIIVEIIIQTECVKTVVKYSTEM